ncbi:MAG: LOG family protein [Candidatus Anammoxibacter sp.]
MKNKEINTLIERLVDISAPADSKDIFRQILSTVVKLGGKSGAGNPVEKGDMKLVNNALKELCRAFNMFSGYRTVRKVAMFGSSRTDTDSIEFQMAKEFAAEIVKHGFMVITGAGGGIMEAGNAGAGADNSFGVNIKLPFEQVPNQYISDDPKCMTFKYFFTRKLMFIKESDATVLFTGGFGTLDEGLESLTLFQTGKCRPRPIIFIEPENSDFWDEWLFFVKKKLLKNGKISESDISLFSHHKNIKDAVQEITDFYKVYKSIQYHKDETILYLTRSINDDTINDIKCKFRDIIVDDKIKMVLEADEIDKKNVWAGVPYLQFKFTRNDFGRLAEMIRYINKNA